MKIGNLNDEKARYHAAAFIARAKLQHDVETTISLPVDFAECNPEMGHVAILKKSGIYGVYVVAERRPGFNFFVGMDGLRSEAQLRNQNPVEFDRIFQEARKYLPRH